MTPARAGRLIGDGVTYSGKINSITLFHKLTDDETEFLRSSGMMSKITRRGSRINPWVVTRKGAIRLATAELEREGKYLELVDKKIGIIERLLKMFNDLEPNAFIRLFSEYDYDNKILPDKNPGNKK